MKESESSLFEVNGPRSSVTQQEIEALSEEIRTIEKMVGELEEAARVDMEPKVDRLKTMEEALIRDAKEVHETKGADQETLCSLYQQIEKESSDLKIEMDALSQGNPTTIATAADAVFRGVDMVIDKLSDNEENNR